MGGLLPRAVWWLSLAGSVWGGGYDRPGAPLLLHMLQGSPSGAGLWSCRQSGVQMARLDPDVPSCVSSYTAPPLGVSSPVHLTCKAVSNW